MKQMENKQVANDDDKTDDELERPARLFDVSFL